MVKYSVKSCGNAHIYCRQCDPVRADKIAEAARKRALDDTYRNKLSVASKKRYQDPEQRRLSGDIHRGKSLTDAQKKKVYEGSVPPLSDVLARGRRRAVKKRLIHEGILLNKCYKCGMGPEWQSEEITLQMDHIDGDALNNSVDNLRILCPNCHSQTPTWAGRNRWKKSV